MGIYRVVLFVFLAFKLSVEAHEERTKHPSKRKSMWSQHARAFATNRL